MSEQSEIRALLEAHELVIVEREQAHHEMGEDDFASGHQNGLSEARNRIEQCILERVNNLECHKQAHQDLAEERAFNAERFEWLISHLDDADDIKDVSITDNAERVWVCGQDGLLACYDTHDLRKYDYAHPSGTTLTWTQIDVSGEAGSESGTVTSQFGPTGSFECDLFDLQWGETDA